MMISNEFTDLILNERKKAKNERKTMNMMETIEGLLQNSEVYVDENQYVYEKDNKTGTKTYLRCKSTSCWARALINIRDPPVLFGRHNHEPNLLTVEIYRFKSYLRKRATDETISFHDIYSEAERLFPNAAIAIGGQKHVQGLMARARRKSIPPIPDNLWKYAKILENTRWWSRYSLELGPGRQPFFNRSLTAADHSQVVIFLSPGVVELFKKGLSTVLFADITLKVVLRSGAAIYLFILHMFYEGTVYPIAYCLMERKTEAAYIAILQTIKDLVPDINISSFMSSYEETVRSAIKQIFPQVQINGCWFHYNHAVYKKALQEDLIHSDDDQSVKILKMSFALALLPHHLINNGCDAILMEASEMVEQINPFLEYIKKQLIPEGIDRIPTASNSAVESFHRDFGRLIFRGFANIWTFTQSLQKMEKRKVCDLRRTIMGEVNQRFSNCAINRRISEAQDRLDADDDVRQFLVFMSKQNMDGIMNLVAAQQNLDEPILTEVVAPPPLPSPPSPLPFIAPPPLSIAPVLPTQPLPEICFNRRKQQLQLHPPPEICFNRRKQQLQHEPPSPQCQQYQSEPPPMIYFKKIIPQQLQPPPLIYFKQPPIQQQQPHQQSQQQQPQQ